MNAKIFREYDIRGIVGEDITDETVELLGKGYGTYLQSKGGKSASLGRDVRLSSKHLRDVLVRGIISTGVDVIDLGEVPTPTSYFSLHHCNVDGGVMITGSHNPPEYNGFKLAVGITSIYGKEIQFVRELIEKGEFATGSGTVSEIDIITPYRETIKNKIKLSSPVKMVVDAGNGTGGIFTPQLLRDVGCEVIEMYCEPDGRFPNHHPDPTIDENVQDLIKKVKETSADLGIGFDGDSDRIGAVDNIGRIVRGDQLVAIFARDVLSRIQNAKIIFEVKCSQALIDDITAHGGIPIMWKTGHSLLKRKMSEENAPLAGEMSGHIFFAENYFGYDDATYAAALLAKILSQSPQSLSEIVDTIPFFYSTPEIRINCPDEQKFDVAERLKSYFRERYQIIDVDGVRVVYSDGWGLVRASNTQPALVARFEAKTEQRLKEIKEEIMEKINEFGNLGL